MEEVFALVGESYVPGAEMEVTRDLWSHLFKSLLTSSHQNRARLARDLYALGLLLL